PIPGNDDAIRSITLFTNLIADAYLEGAKEWEQKARARTDKDSDAKEKQAPRAAAKETTAGPAVSRKPKRKLVAAGTADDVEIPLELENKDTTTTETTEE